MNRMKIIITVLLCTVSSCLYGQPYKKFEKLEKPWKEYNEVLIHKMTFELNLLQRNLDSLRNMRRQRDMLLNSGSADPASSQRKKNASQNTMKPYVSVADLAQRYDRTKDDSLKSVYETLVKMYESVNENGGYVPKDNENFKKSIPGVKKAIQGLSPEFKESVEELANQIESFQYAMPELEQAKKRVDGLNFESFQEYIAELDKNYEIEFVKMIPYTFKQLNEYIDNKIKRDRDNAELRILAEKAQQRKREGVSGDGKKNDGSENGKSGGENNGSMPIEGKK